MLSEEPLSVQEVAQMLHLGRNKVYELARSGELGSYRVGRKLRFTMRDVSSYLESHHNVPADVGFAKSGSAVVHEPTDGGRRYLAGILEREAAFTVAGSDPMAALVASELNQGGLATANRYMSSFAALVGLYLGDVDIAIADLYDVKTNGYNTAFVQRLAPGTPVLVISLLERKRGFVVARGNPKRITTWGALLREGVRLAQQGRGTAGRVLLDEKLMSMEAFAENIVGYGEELASDLEAASMVATGEADVAICTETAAAKVGDVDFVFMQTERLDMVVRKSRKNRKLVRAVKELTCAEGFCAVAEAVSGGDARRMGSIVFEC